MSEWEALPQRTRKRRARGSAGEGTGAFSSSIGDTSEEKILPATAEEEGQRAAAMTQKPAGSEGVGESVEESERRRATRHAAVARAVEERSKITLSIWTIPRMSSYIAGGKTSSERWRVRWRRCST